MAPVRTNNLERGRWRDRCRNQLSHHIGKTNDVSYYIQLTVHKESRLGIVIEPSQVRLIPRGDDPYRWKFLAENTYLFSKNISDHSIGAYKKLCQGVGTAFEALPAPSVTRNSFNSTEGAISIVSKS